MAAYMSRVLATVLVLNNTTAAVAGHCALQYAHTHSNVIMQIRASKPACLSVLGWWTNQMLDA
jgi:hypothetical protein